MPDSRFFKKTRAFSVEEVCALTGATCDADAARLIHDVGTLEEAGEGQAACFHNRAYLEAFKNTKASFCFVTKELAPHAPEGLVCLVTASPYRAFGLFCQALYPSVDREFEACDTRIHPTAILGEGCIVEPGAVVMRNAHVGEGTHIGANAVVGKGVVVGKNCVIEPCVTLSHCVLGDNIVLLAGARIGQAGFGFFMDEKGHVKVPQLGRVIIEDNVEIGAGTTIDRGSMSDTVVGRGSRIDNLVQLGHNVRLGKGCVIVAQVGIAGSTQLGDYVIAAGQAGLAGHLKIGSGVRIAAQSGIVRDVPEGQTVAGTPAVPVKQWHRQSVMLAKLVTKEQS